VFCLGGKETGTSAIAQFFFALNTSLHVKFIYTQCTYVLEVLITRRSSSSNNVAFLWGFFLHENMTWQYCMEMKPLEDMLT
jgi:hypothetical protein